MRKSLTAITALALSVTATPAFAADYLWLDSDHTSYSGYYGNGQSLSFSSGGVNVTASAWSINNSGNINTARLGVWDQGIGVLNASTDNSHTVDNSGYLDFILLQFDQVVELQNARFNTGWHNMYDTDATIGYAVSALPFVMPSTLTGLSSALTLYGSNASSGNNTRDINPGDNVGNLWLIGASFANPDRKLDGFKVEKLTFNTPPPAVPEPATWLMMILGFGLVGGVMRANKRRENLTVSYS
jgi:hypothetical protein